MSSFLERMLPITSSQKFLFQCQQCGACCRHVQESVPLESLDVYRLAKYLKEQGKVLCVDSVLAEYADLTLLDECGYMTYVLKTYGPEGSCIFLKDNHCTVHEAKPRACRTYPIEVSPGGKEKYEKVLCMDYTHHFNGPQRSVEKWLLRYFTKEDQEFLDCDTGSVMRIAGLLRKVPKGKMTYAMNLFIYYKYTALELDKPFMEQFRKNNKNLIAALEKIVQESEM